MALHVIGKSSGNSAAMAGSTLAGSSARMSSAFAPQPHLAAVALK